MSVLQFEKFHQGSKIATKLASLASEVSGVNFTSRLNVKKELVSAWKNRQEVELISDKILLASMHIGKHIINIIQPH